MKISNTEKKRIRKSFGQRPQFIDVPYLLSIQVDSYDRFITPDHNGDCGLSNAIKSVFPIVSANGQAILEYDSFRLDEPEFNVRECLIRGASYQSSLRVKLRYVQKEKDGKEPVLAEPFTPRGLGRVLSIFDVPSAKILGLVTRAITPVRETKEDESGAEPGDAGN